MAPKGLGGDIGKTLVIGGVAFSTARGPVAHSDGDALMHAITDAILGAVGLPDIGQLFPDRDPTWAGAKSEVFLKEAVRLASDQGWGVGNVDATVILEQPKLGPRKQEIRENLAAIIGVPVDRINLKGKTHELVHKPEEDPLIEAMAVALMIRK
jgi:2-C-methyl-D-erythritol 2,4-cyclodiphosphate synthase